MAVPQIVIDTNILVSALRSNRGASYLLLTLIDTGKFEINISVPLVLEYESELKRIRSSVGLDEADIDALIDFVCSTGNPHAIDYLWRPFLKDAKDDMVLEVAVQAGCDSILTYNERDFRGVGCFGIEVQTPKSFLQRIGVLP